LKSLGRFPDHSYEAFFVILEIDGDSTLHYELLPYRILNEGKHIAAMSPEDEKILRKKLDKLSEPLNLGYKEYYRFYRSSKRRKFRPVLGKNHTRNSLSIWFAFLLLRGIRDLSSVFARLWISTD